MTRQSTKQRGVTLVEVTLTLAISALLITTVLAGRNSIRSQAQFSDGVERIKETILSTKSEASTSNNVNTKAKGTGQIGDGTSRYLNLGRSIRFEKDSSIIQVLTVLCYAGDGNLCTEDLNEDGATDEVTTLPWGIIYKSYTVGGVTQTGTQLSIIFTRNDTDGSFTGYWLEGRVSDSKKPGAKKRSELLVNTTPITLNFESQDGRKATIDVNPATGTVTRTIL